MENSEDLNLEKLFKCQPRLHNRGNRKHKRQRELLSRIARWNISDFCGISEEAASTKQAQRSATDLIRTMMFCPVVLKSYSSSKPLARRPRFWPRFWSIISHRNHKKLHFTENDLSTLKIAELSSSSQLFSK